MEEQDSNLPLKRVSPKRGKKQEKQRTKRNLQPKQAVNERKKNLFVRLQESDEGKALWILWTDKRFASHNGRANGHLDGYTHKQWKRIATRAKEEAKIIVEYMMSKDLIPKDAYAKEAIEAVVEIMRLPAHPRDKLAAAKTLLEYTMAKPASTANVNVKTAEDFLAEVAKDAGIE